MIRQLTRRFVLLAAATGTSALAACSNPLAPVDGSLRANAESGVYGGSGTRANASEAGGVYGGSGTRANASEIGGVYGGSGTRANVTTFSGVYGGSGT
jgi:hypothetical protein